jgi:hypothetical protein|tara:strand:- start:13 stop:450 length:438 start_codon:yes stop_codon:yes gene_type:complete
MTTKNLATALIKFHDSGAAAKKGAANPFFKSKYASLEEVIETVRAEAGKVGLTFTQLVDFDEHHIFVTTILMHESGESVTGRTPVLTKDNTDPQKMGSGITYAKRYGLQAAFGLPSEDDDGNAASVSNPKVQKVSKKKEADDAWD